MTHTLYLSYDGMTDPLGQSQVIPYLEGLSQAGYKVSLISFEKEEQLERKPFIQNLMDQAGIDWHPLPYTKKPPVLSTVKDLRAMRKKALELHRKHPFQLVHCRSYIAGLTGLWMKRKLGIKFLFDMRGFWADERIEGGIWSESNPVFKQVYQYFKKKELQFFAEADYSISLTHNGKEEIQSWKSLPNQPVPIEVIPCCVDIELFKEENFPEKSAIREEIGFDDSQLVLSYLGSIGTWYMLPEMLRFFKQLHEQKAEARFFFITGEQPEKIYEEASRQGVAQDLITVQKANREDVPKLLKATDLSIFFIKPVFSKKASSPTKQGEIMSMGIPIICNTKVGDTDFVINEYQAGALVEEFSPEAFQQVIDQLPQIQKLDKKELRRGAKEFYALEEGVRRYVNVYRTMLRY